jgi:thymidine kinase
LAKLYFSYSTMNAGKSTLAAAGLVQLPGARHAHSPADRKPSMTAPALESIASRIGLDCEAHPLPARTMISIATLKRLMATRWRYRLCAFVDEAQFLTEDQVWQLARAADRLNDPGDDLWPAHGFSRAAVSWAPKRCWRLADELREVRTICHCGRKATMVAREPMRTATLMREGAQIEVGGNDRSMCRIVADIGIEVMNPDGSKNSAIMVIIQCPERSSLKPSRLKASAVRIRRIALVAAICAINMATLIF